jgi:hypothetical protein
VELMGAFITPRFWVPPQTMESEYPSAESEQSILQSYQLVMTLMVWGPMVCLEPALTAEETKFGACSGHTIPKQGLNSDHQPLA